MDITISGIQFDIIWEDRGKNIEKIESMLSDIPDDTDILILPEMFTTGFSMKPADLAESMDGETIRWIKEQSEKKNIVIAGSIIINDAGLYRNRFLWVEPNGTISYYDKRHSFGLAGESKYYTCGKEKITFEYKGWKFLPSICYDLRFPVWMKNNMEYHVIINVANWPSPRTAHWTIFLISRAIENQSYLIGINRVGTDGEGRYYTGDSAIITHNGNCLTRLSKTEGIISAKLSMEKLLEYRKEYPFLKDQDNFSISI